MDRKAQELGLGQGQAQLIKAKILQLCTFNAVLVFFFTCVLVNVEVY